MPVTELCRTHGMSDATFYNWRAKYGDMDVSMMKRMKELEEENRRLKKMYAEERLKAEIIQEARPVSEINLKVSPTGRPMDMWIRLMQNLYL